MFPREANPTGPRADTRMGVVQRWAGHGSAWASMCPTMMRGGHRRQSSGRPPSAPGC
ncbi:hypothetical protein GGTG_11937 [Gaeumannomyces tritici R3-111a-1]|uniref:Uncharacterized protein n=1 Tax=Gaeumannomyces tritici (strain R3-111a-1) TaxID=644352 RepID=J3PEK6_GAET3|nr:hypothetical protein GGTG_11937 [Gaeumannomyces tritici R3-111a-1]EJT70914.1 hypothetical protein GGTG_11937 [Gaeumannomyces tritici R3-111a-1]